jgi:hypothetical protein
MTDTAPADIWRFEIEKRNMKRFLHWFGWLNQSKRKNLLPKFFPDLENFTYRIAISPANTKILAWGKLRECERRLAIYRWAAELNNPRTPQHRVLLNDAVSAFLLTYEATVQFLKNQFGVTPNAPDFDQWLLSQPEYDITVRGIRTLRHFEAHVESKPQPRTVRISLSVGASERLDGVDWKLPKLQSSDIAKLRNSPLKPQHLPDWHLIVDGNDAPAVFGTCLSRLKDILSRAEALL